MHKAKTAKVLSAAALANIAAVGVVAAPATAASHPAASTAMPSAGRPHPGVMFKSGRTLRPAAKGGALTVGAIPAKSRGFVPRAAPGARINTETGCNNYICVGLIGGGNHVSAFNAHWFAGSPSSPCRNGALGYREPNGSGKIVPFRNICYKQQISIGFPSSSRFPTGTNFCATFSGFPGSGLLCEPVR